MKALIAHAPGGPEHLVYTEAAAPPVLTAGDVIVRVHAAGITRHELNWSSNWVDQSGHSRTAFIPAREFAGEVVALGFGSYGFEVGDRVFGVADRYRDGAAAEFIAVETRSIALIPPGLSFVFAAALPLAGLAAWQALFAVGQASPGDEVLVLGVSGSVGTLAVQLANHGGLRVVAARLMSDASPAMALGVHDYLDLGPPSLPEALRFKLIVDTIGPQATRCALPLLAPSGTVVSVVEQPPRQLGNRGRFFLVETDRAHLELLADRAQSGHLRPPHLTLYPLSNGQRAFIDKGERRVHGKVLLLPDDEQGGVL